ncbi:MAG: minor capsid protein [Sarcina sp.]
MISVKLKVDSNNINQIKEQIKKAQPYFVQQVSDNIDSYIPVDTSNLRSSKNTTENSISWNAVNPRTPEYGSYAAKNYYSNSNGMVFWDKRMWADRGEGIVKSVADFIIGG